MLQTFFILIAILAIVVIFQAVRKSIRRRRLIQRRLAEIADSEHGGASHFRITRHGEVTSVEAQALRDHFRHRHGDLTAHWDDMPDYVQRQIDGEPLSAAQLAPPNIGGVDHPAYSGPNFAEAEDIAEEMKTTIYFDSPDGEEFRGHPRGAHLFPARGLKPWPFED